jgi:hypothetical protein
MLDGINPLGGQPQVNGPTRRTDAEPAARFKVASPAQEPDLGFPAAPPPDALAELDKAARVLDELRQKQVNLHFEVQRDRIHVQVRDGSGHVVREIPATKMLDVLAGDTTALAAAK